MDTPCLFIGPHCCTKCKLDKSALGKPVWDHDHQIKWKDSELLASVSNYYSREICESIEIHKNQTIPQEGKPLHDTWTSLF